MSRYSGEFLGNYKIPTKVCSECKEEKIIHEFSKTHKTDLLVSKCKVCLKKRAKLTASKRLAKDYSCVFNNFGKI